MKRFSHYRTDRLSSIPNMASSISKKISEFQFDYRKLVDEAEEFFTKYFDDEKVIAELDKKIAIYQEQLDIVETYRREKGKLPVIKGQRSTERYLVKLNRNLDKALSKIKQIEQERFVERTERFMVLDKLVDNILDLLDGQKIFSQFLGTMVLSTPLPNENVRCVRNEKNKPIYITALTVALFEEIRLFYQFKTPYLKETLSEIIGNDQVSLLLRHGNAAFPNEQKMAYREEVLKPIVKATLLRHIGSYSPEALNIYQGNRFRLLPPVERSELLSIIKQHSLLYIDKAIGLPSQRFDKREEKQAFLAFETSKLSFIKQLLDFDNQSTEIRDIMRIPMVYASFMLSTKEEFDYRLMYRAYDTLKEGIKQSEYNGNFCALFLRMVGRFPLGSGIYFISHETGNIEKGIVSSLYPRNPEEPYVKQITRNQIQSLSQTEVIVSKNTNIFFAVVRQESEFDDQYFEARFNSNYVWNANEVWEVQVPALTFWKKDGTIKESSQALL